MIIVLLLDRSVNRKISERKVKWNLGTFNRRPHNVLKTSSKGPPGDVLRRFFKGHHGDVDSGGSCVVKLGRLWEFRSRRPWNVRSGRSRDVKLGRHWDSQIEYLGDVLGTSWVPIFAGWDSNMNKIFRIINVKMIIIKANIIEWSINNIHIITGKCDIISSGKWGYLGQILT